MMISPAPVQRGGLLAEPAPTNAIAFPAATARVHRLNNGLVVLVQEDHSAPVASVQAWVHTGSIHEGAWLGAGMSHLLEHMLFKGTAKRSTNAIAQAIQDEGGYINAYTSFDRTVYWIDVPRAGVATALDVLADAMLHSALPADEFIKEQEVIRREFAMVMDDPDRVASQQLFATAYREHPYRHPVIGYLDVFNQLTREDVLGYYRARYVPNNFTFIVVGDVDADTVCAQLEQFFENYPQRALPPTFLPPESPQLGRRTAQREFPTELSRLAGAWHIPAITHPDVPALDVLATALGEGRSSRLYKRVREGLGLAHSIGAYTYVPAQPGLFGFDATTDPDKRAAATDEILKIIAEVQREGISAPELEKAKKILLSNQLGALVTMRGQASDLGSNWQLTGNLDFSRDYLAAIQRVNGDDVVRVAREYLVEDKFTLSSLDPEGATSQHRAATESAVGAGEVQKFTLANGLRVLVREDARLPLVNVDAIFRGGLLSETAATNGLTKLFARALLKGTASRTGGEIADAIEAVGGSISADAGNNSVGVSLEVLRPDLGLALDLLADIVRHANFPAAVVEREKTVQLAGLKAEDEHPTSRARNLLRKKLFGAHPYGLRNGGTPETLARVTRAELLAYQQRYFVAQNGVVAVFGNVRANDVRARLETLFGDLPAGEQAFVEPPATPALAADIFAEEEMDKEQAVLMIGYRGITVHDPARHAVELIDEACSDLGSRFFIRIREELGLAYFVGSSQMPGLAPGVFNFYVGTDPAKLTLVRAAFQEEIARLAEHGLSAEELERAKKKLIGKQAIAHQSNSSLAFTASLDELYGLGYLHYRDVPAAIEAVTLADVRAAARHLFHRQPAVTAVVRPEEEG